jgi:hypothetical protein
MVLWLYAFPERSQLTLLAKSFQHEVKLSAQLIFKTPSMVHGHSPMTLLPPSPFARRVPLHVHPSLAQPTPMFTPANFYSQVKWAEDQAIRERNRALGRGDRPAVGGGGLEWGAWLEFVDSTEKINEALLPFAADLVKNIPELLPKDQRPPPRCA